MEGVGCLKNSAGSSPLLSIPFHSLSLQSLCMAEHQTLKLVLGGKGAGWWRVGMGSLQFQSEERAEVATSSQGSWVVEGWNGFTAVSV